MKMTMREIWSLTCDEKQIAPSFEVSDMKTAEFYRRQWMQKRDKAIKNLFSGKRWDAKD